MISVKKHTHVQCVCPCAEHSPAHVKFIFYYIKKIKTFQAQIGSWAMEETNRLV